MFLFRTLGAGIYIPLMVLMILSRSTFGRGVLVCLGLFLIYQLMTIG